MRVSTKWLSGTLHAPLIDQLAEAIAAFHRRCDSAPSDRTLGTPDEIRRWTMDNLSELQRLTSITSQRQRIERLARWTEVEFARRAPVFAERRAAGCVRESRRPAPGQFGADQGSTGSV